RPPRLGARASKTEGRVATQAPPHPAQATPAAPVRIDGAGRETFGRRASCGPPTQSSSSTPQSSPDSVQQKPLAILAVPLALFVGDQSELRQRVNVGAVLVLRGLR